MFVWQIDYFVFWLVKEYCELVKFKFIYVDKLLEMICEWIGWIYVSFYQMLVVIGCLLLSDLNFQNIFVWIDLGCWIWCVFVVWDVDYVLLIVDYLQIELWVFVYFSQDDVLRMVFVVDQDIYCVVVLQVFSVGLDVVMVEQWV